MEEEGGEEEENNNNKGKERKEKKSDMTLRNGAIVIRNSILDGDVLNTNADLD